MVQRFFLNEHFKIIFCWLSSLVVSIRVLVLRFSFLTGFSGFSGFIIWRHTSIRLSFLLQFSFYRIVSIILRWTLQKNLLPCQLCKPQQKSLESFILIAQLMVQIFFFGAYFKTPFCWLSLYYHNIEKYNLKDAHLKITICHAFCSLDFFSIRTHICHL